MPTFRTAVKFGSTTVAGHEVKSATSITAIPSGGRAIITMLRQGGLDGPPAGASCPEATLDNMAGPPVARVAAGLRWPDAPRGDLSGRRTAPADPRP
jgi:hypothetical protein